jgi:hypothetical protein
MEHGRWLVNHGKQALRELLSSRTAISTRKIFITPIVPKFGTASAIPFVSLLVLGFLGVHQKGRRIDRVSQGFAALFFVF